MTRRALLAAISLAGALQSCAEPPLPVAPRVPAALASALSGVAEPPPARADGRLPAGVVPLRYDLALRIDPGQPTFSGTVRIGVKLVGATGVIVLHARHMTLRGARAVTVAGAIEASTVARAAAGGKGDPEELVLTFPAALAAGEVTLELSWEIRRASCRERVLWYV